MDAHFARAHPGQFGGGDGPALGGDDLVPPLLVGEPVHPRLQRVRRAAQPGGQLGGRQGAAAFDAGGALFGRGVHRGGFAGRGPVDQVGQRLGVGCHMGGDVGAGPPGQGARRCVPGIVESCSAARSPPYTRRARCGPSLIGARSARRGPGGSCGRTMMPTWSAKRISPPSGFAFVRIAGQVSSCRGRTASGSCSTARLSGRWKESPHHYRYLPTPGSVGRTRYAIGSRTSLRVHNWPTRPTSHGR